jgi:hypothetical protein
LLVTDDVVGMPGFPSHAKERRTPPHEAGLPYTPRTAAPSCLWKPVDNPARTLMSFASLEILGRCRRGRAATGNACKLENNFKNVFNGSHNARYLVERIGLVLPFLINLFGDCL